MDLNEAARVVRGRWYVLLPLLLLTLVATYGVDKAEPTKYQATSTFSLLASQQAVQGTASVPGTDNAFLSFDASLNDMADFLTRRVDAPDSAQQLLQLGVTEAYSADLAANAEGPFITLTVTGTDPAHVTASMNTLLKFSEQELAQIQTQASVAPSAMIAHGRVSCSACVSSARQLGFGSTAAAPACEMASWAVIHSGRLGAISATRSPGPMPMLISACAAALHRPSSSRSVYCSS